MKILLDTYTFLWMATDAPGLSQRAKDLFQDPDHDLFLSAVSGWEISIKYSLGRLLLPEPPERFVPSRRELITWRLWRFGRKRYCMKVACPGTITILSIAC